MGGGRRGGNSEGTSRPETITSPLLQLTKTQLQKFKRA